MFDADFKRGFELGKAYRPTLLRAAVKGEPVAYLYGPNKVRLPKLPEWDRKICPWATIADRGSTGLFLLLTALPLTTPVDGRFSQFVKTATDCLYMRYVIENGVWVLYTELTTSGASESYRDLVWSNYDIPYLDGTVYLPASDPVPVYE